MSSLNFQPPPLSDSSKAGPAGTAKSPLSSKEKKEQEALYYSELYFANKAFSTRSRPRLKKQEKSVTRDQHHTIDDQYATGKNIKKTQAKSKNLDDYSLSPNFFDVFDASDPEDHVFEDSDVSRKQLRKQKAAIKKQEKSQTKKAKKKYKKLITSSQKNAQEIARQEKRALKKNKKRAKNKKKKFLKKNKNNAQVSGKETQKVTKSIKQKPGRFRKKSFTTLMNNSARNVGSNALPPYGDRVVYLVRHGEVYNPEGILYGRLSGYNLSDVGRKMADRLADYFADKAEAGEKFISLSASPLERTQQTAAPIAQALELPIDQMPEVIESSNVFEGHRVNPKMLMRPKNAQYLKKPLEPSWGEPYEKIAQRMTGQIYKILKNIDQQANNDDDTPAVVIVSHQLPIWSARQKLMGKKLPHMPYQRQCSLASVTRLEYNGDELVKISYEEPTADLVQ